MDEKTKTKVFFGKTKQDKNDKNKEVQDNLDNFQKSIDILKSSIDSIKSKNETILSKISENKDSINNSIVYLSNKMTNMWNQVSLFLQFSGEESNLSLFASSIRKDFYKTRGKNNKDNNKDTNKSELMSLTNRNINNHSVANNPGDLTSRIVVNNNFDPYFKVDNNSNINWPGTPLSNNNHAKTSNINNNSNQLSKFSTLKKSSILNPSVKFDNKTTDISKVATKNKNKSLNLNSSQQNVVSNLSDNNNNNSMVFSNPNLDKKLIYIIVNNNNSTGNEIKIDSNLINNSLSNIQNNNNKSFSYNAYKTFSNNKPFKNIQFDRTNINNCDSSKQNLNTNNQIQNMKNTQNLLSDNYYCTHQTKASLSILENIYTKAMKSFELSMVNSKTAKEKKDSVKLLIKTLKPVMLNLKFLRDKLEFNNDCLKETNKILSLEINEIEVDKSKEKFCLHCHKTFKLKSKIENKEELNCIYHPGALKYFSCRGCGADEYYSCCFKCGQCSQGCQKGKHVCEM